MTEELSEIAMARVSTREDVIALGKDLRLEMREMEQRLPIRICGAVAAMLTLAVAVLKLT